MMDEMVDEKFVLRCSGASRGGEGGGGGGGGPIVAA